VEWRQTPASGRDAVARARRLLAPRSSWRCGRPGDSAMPACWQRPPFALRRASRRHQRAPSLARKAGTRRLLPCARGSRRRPRPRAAWEEPERSLRRGADYRNARRGVATERQPVLLPPLSSFGAPPASVASFVAACGASSLGLRFRPTACPGSRCLGPPPRSRRSRCGAGGSPCAGCAPGCETASCAQGC
jgi:hypothetical protein